MTFTSASKASVKGASLRVLLRSPPISLEITQFFKSVVKVAKTFAHVVVTIYPSTVIQVQRAECVRGAKWDIGKTAKSIFQILTSVLLAFGSSTHVGTQMFLKHQLSHHATRINNMLFLQVL